MSARRFKPKSSGRPLTSFCHLFCGSAQGKVKGSGEEGRSEPPALPLRKETGVKPKWVWLRGFSHFSLPPRRSPAAQVLLYDLTPPAPVPLPCPREPGCLPCSPHHPHSVRNYGPNSLSGLRPFPNLLICLSSHSCHRFKQVRDHQGGAPHHHKNH